jgi:hypothetical protein
MSAGQLGSSAFASQLLKAQTGNALAAAIGDAKFLVQTPNVLLPNAQAMSSLATGLVKNTTGTGVQSIATAGVDYESPLTFSTGLSRSVNTITNTLRTGINGDQTIIGGTTATQSLIIRPSAGANVANVTYFTADTQGVGYNWMSIYGVGNAEIFAHANSGNDALVSMSAFANADAETYLGVTRGGMSMVQFAPTNANFAAIGTGNASDLVFFTNGTDRGRFKSTGELGLGTDTPGARLHLYGAAAIDVAVKLSSNAGNTNVFLKAVDGGGVNGGLQIQRGDGTALMTMNNSTLSTTFAGTVRVPDGSAAAPSYSFTNDTNTGIWSPGNDRLEITVGGIQLMYFTTNQVQSKDGDASLPMYAFASDPDTGMFRQAANALSLSAGGTESLRVTNTQVRAGDGGAAAPGFSFINDNALGMYRIGSNNLGFSANGSLRLRVDSGTINGVAVAGSLYTEHLRAGNTNGSTGTITVYDSGGTAITVFDSGQLQMQDGRAITAGDTNGLKIATSVLQKIGFYNKTPVVQGASVADATGGATIDSEARTAINSLLSRIRDLGLIAT